MSFFPEGFDPRDPVAGLLHLVEVDTPDGIERFMLFSSGVFHDVNGNAWVGSELVRDEALGFGLGGTAKASAITMSFFDDPMSDDDLIGELRTLGAAYVKGRDLTLFVQPLNSIEEMYAPVFAPQKVATMVMDHLTFDAPNAVMRSITLHLEGAFKVRGGARGLVYNVTDHARQIGVANPSYEFIPTEPREEQVFGT